MPDSYSHNVPMEAEYITALGRAIFIFARLEWQVVWCCEKIQPGSIKPLADRTAGGVAKTFLSLTSKAPSAIASELNTEAHRFSELVKKRNDIVHGKPGTTRDGEQRLFRAGKPLSIKMIDKVSEEFSSCASTLNRIFYDHLNAMT